VPFFPVQVGQTLLEGYIRPGCTQLTLNALVPLERKRELQVGPHWGQLACWWGTCRGGHSMTQ